MSPHLLSLPTELVHNILSPLPLHSLLSFSQTCHQARTLTSANLHTLSLCIAPSSSPSFPSLSDSDKTSPPSQRQSYETCLHIPQQETYDHAILFNFQSALVTSLLRRHGMMLQTLELSVWGWTVGMALALRSLRALRTLRVRVESVNRVGRNVSRKWIAVQRAEEKKAWDVLVRAEEEREEGKGKEVATLGKRKRRRERGFWSERLTTLELENCDVSAEQLGVVLGRSRGCRDVRLDGCGFLDGELWTCLEEWEGRGGLERLVVVDCGGRIGEEAREAIGGMNGLKHLNLYDCQEQDPGSMQQCNDNLWHIPDFIAPAPARGVGQNMIIEVDPEYM